VALGVGHRAALVDEEERTIAGGAVALQRDALAALDAQ